MALLLVACMSFSVTPQPLGDYSDAGRPAPAGRWDQHSRWYRRFPDRGAIAFTGVVVEKTGAFYLAFVVAESSHHWSLLVGGGRAGGDGPVGAVTLRFRWLKAPFPGRTMYLEVVPTFRVPRKPEVMSPAGYWPQLRAAAVEAGTSQVFGLKHFTARAQVGLFTGRIAGGVRTLHSRGVKGFVLPLIPSYQTKMQEAARASAAIADGETSNYNVQDVGVMQLAHEIAPDLELHASTPMSITSAGVRFSQNSSARPG